MDKTVIMKIELPKIPDIELVALVGLERLANHLGIEEEKIGEARILVTEAIINAFEHSGDDNPTINVEYNMTKAKLIIFVRDYGKGFNPDEVAEPDIFEKMKSSGSKRGWGLKLMRTMSDDLQIESSSKGTKITIIKNLV